MEDKLSIHAHDIIFLLQPSLKEVYAVSGVEITTEVYWDAEVDVLTISPIRLSLYLVAKCWAIAYTARLATTSTTIRVAA